MNITVVTFCIILLFSLTCPAEKVFKERKGITPFYAPDNPGLVSPLGSYYVKLEKNNAFDIYNLMTGEYVLRSKYIAWTSPHPEFSHPEKIFFGFSPDEKYIVTDNYAGSTNWIEVWEIKRMRIIKQFPDILESFRPYNFTYNLDDVLSGYYNTAPFKAYSRNARIIFSDDGSKIFFLYPVIRVFTFPGFKEINGTFNMVGVDRRHNGPLYLNLVGAPVFIDNGKTMVMPVKGQTFFFFDFYDKIQNYTKVQGQHSHIEVSADNNVVLLNNALFRTRYWAVRKRFTDNAYISDDNQRILSGNDTYRATPNYDKLPKFHLDKGSLIPSSTREFIFVQEPQKRALYVYAFSGGNIFSGCDLRQKIRISADEEIFKNTDDGKLLILKNNHTGKIRIFERQ